MHLLFRTWNKIIPIGILSDKWKTGDSIHLWGRDWYINCQPGQVSPKGEIYKHFYCVKQGRKEI